MAAAVIVEMAELWLSSLQEVMEVLKEGCVGGFLPLGRGRYSGLNLWYLQHS